MRNAILATFFLSLAAASPADHADSAPRGKLLVVGGGGTTDAIIERAFALCGGKGARMLVVPQAAEDAATSGRESAEFWREKGGQNVTVIDVAKPDEARAAIAAADFVWMPGGDQVRLMEELEKAGLVDAIRARYEHGALVGGTSAGAAVISNAMILGGEDKADRSSVRAGGTQIGRGLGLLTNAIVDQHFMKRQRFNRLLACTLEHPALVGVGIDERTAIVVTEGHLCEVVGESAVTVIDARSAKRSVPKDGERFSASGVVLDVRLTGERFDLERR